MMTRKDDAIALLKSLIQEFESDNIDVFTFMVHYEKQLEQFPDPTNTYLESHYTGNEVLKIYYRRKDKLPQ